MNRKKKAVCVSLILFLTLVFQVLFSPSPKAAPPDEIATAAKEGLNKFLKEIPPQNLQHMGFQIEKDNENTELGEGFQVYTIHPDKILKFEKGAWLLKDLLTPTNLWEFIVVEGGKAQAVLTVDLMGNKWIAVAIGASGLATQLKNFTDAWPNSSGYQYKFIRIYQALADFLEVSQGENIIGVIPLTSARAALALPQMDFNPLELLNFEDILMGLKPIVRENLKK
jgi:hypothetical protein